MLSEAKLFPAAILKIVRLTLQIFIYLKYCKHNKVKLSLVMYSIAYHREAMKDLKRIDKQWQVKIMTALEALAINPFESTQVKKLVNSPFYRLRVGGYRIVYDIRQGQMVILVIHIKKRADAYR